MSVGSFLSAELVANLVNASRPFMPVYSLSRHASLGFLLGAYVVELTDEGHLSYNFQRLLPENLDRFAHSLDENDQRLAQVLNEIGLKRLFQQFKRKETSLEVFLQQLPQNPHLDYIRQYISRRLAQALPLLTNKGVYHIGSDGYPAKLALSISPEPAEAVFHIRRRADGIHSRLRFYVGREEYALHQHASRLVLEEPAWLIINRTLVQVTNVPNGRRLKPYLTQEKVIVPPEKEQQYFEGFFQKLLQECDLELEGIDVRDIRQSPRFELEVSRSSDRSLTLRPRVNYGGHRYTADPKQRLRIERENRNGEVRFLRLHRDPDAEESFDRALDPLRRGRESLVDLTLPIGEAADWLAEQQQGFHEQGIQVRQPNDEETFVFERPHIRYELEPLSDGAYLLKAEVNVGETSLPLHALQGNVLEDEPTYQLPDGRYFVIPTAWREDFQHLFQVAERTDEGFRLAPYQLSILRRALKGKAEVSADRFLDFEQIENQPKPAGLLADLRDYQHAGYEWLCFLKDYSLGGILADDMGLGKTMQALAAIQQLHETEGMEAPALIIVPNSILYNWILEAERFTPALKSTVYAGPKRAGLLNKLFDYQLVLTTYGTVRRDVEKLRSIEFAFLILDESHYIKNREAKTTRAVFQLQGRRRLTLTGTPIENSTMDLWTQMHFLNPGLLGKATFFERYYATPIEKEKNTERAAELRELTRPFILRRTKEMVAQDLPPRSEQVLYGQMLPAQERLYKQVASLYKSTLFEQTDEENPLKAKRIQILSSIQKLRQIAIHPQLIDPEVGQSGKLDQLKEKLWEIVDSGSKVLIFSQFVKLLKILQPELKKMRVRHSYLDGSMQAQNRAEEVKRFQEDDSVQAFLISLKAGGVGLNLTAADYVFILDPWWNPAVEQQAINRAHRIGQTRAVFVYKFITRGTIEEKILKLQEEKRKLASEVIQTEEQFFKTLSRDELIALFDS